MAAREAGGNAEITQNAVATIAHAMGNAGVVPENAHEAPEGEAAPTAVDAPAILDAPAAVEPAAVEPAEEPRPAAVETAREPRPAAVGTAPDIDADVEPARKRIRVTAMRPPRIVPPPRADVGADVPLPGSRPKASARTSNTAQNSASSSSRPSSSTRRSTSSTFNQALIRES